MLHPVRLSVRPVPPIFSKLESRRNFQFTGNIVLDKTDYRSLLGGGSEGQGHWQRQFINRFRRKSFVKSRLIYVKLRTKSPTVHSTHIVGYISQAKMLCFVIICNVQIIRECRMLQRPPGRVPTCCNYCTVRRSLHVLVFTKVDIDMAITSVCLPFLWFYV